MRKRKALLLFVVAALVLSACSMGIDYSEDKEDRSLSASGGIGTVAGSFTVLAINVDGLPAFLQGNGGHPEINTPLIGEKLGNYNIVNAQEDFNYHAALYEADQHPFRTPTSGGAGIGSGLNTMSDFPFYEGVERVTWDERNGTDGNNLTPKGFIMTRQRLEEGVYLDVYNLHTCAGTSDSSLDARQDNILQILAYIDENSKGNAVLVFGDTNCRYTRSGDNIREMLDAGFHDAWIELERNGDLPVQGSDALVYEGTEVIPEEDYPNIEVVDKVFYRSNGYITLIPTSYSMEDEEFRDAEGNMLSDHRPIAVNFTYSLDADLILSDSFGGPHGTNFNDVNALPQETTIRKIGLRAGSRVDQVNLTYADGTFFSHGGTGGDAATLALDEGEFVQSVTLCSGKKDGHTRIFYIGYTTSSGRTLNGGTITGDTVTYTAPGGYQIAGFFGRSGSEVDKLGVIFRLVE